jgi:hypothetical protein
MHNIFPEVTAKFFKAKETWKKCAEDGNGSNEKE